jgi:hypothetical protein
VQAAGEHRPLTPARQGKTSHEKTNKKSRDYLFKTVAKANLIV